MSSGARKGYPVTESTQDFAGAVRCEVGLPSRPKGFDSPRPLDNRTGQGRKSVAGHLRGLVQGELSVFHTDKTGPIPVLRSYDGPFVERYLLLREWSRFDSWRLHFYVALV